MRVCFVAVALLYLRVVVALLKSLNASLEAARGNWKETTSRAAEGNWKEIDVRGSKGPAQINVRIDVFVWQLDWQQEADGDKR